AWSDIKNSQSSTKAYGTFLAKGGASSGDGGRIETSGYLLDVDNIQVDASSTNGDAGLWLLDPYNITIGTSESGTSYGNSFTASATSNILASDISSALVNNNVSISTGTDNSGSSAGIITVSNAISKASGAEKTLTLDGNRNIVLNANISGASGSPLNVIISTGSGALTGASNLVLEGGDLSIEAGGDGTYSGVFSGAGNLTKTGDGTQTLSGTNTYTGTTSVDNGVLAISNAAGLGATDGATTVANAAALNISGGINVAEAITISGSGVSNNGVIRSTSGNNTLSGQITISAHAQIQSDANTLTLNVASSSSITASNKNITFDGAGNITVADPIATGSGTLTKTGSGTLTLSAANTYTGATTISAGVATISNNTSFGTTDAATTIASGAALNVSGGVTVAEAITINGTGVSSNGAIRSTSGDNTFSGLVTLGAHSEIQSDANTLTLNVSSGNAITGTYNLTFDGSGDTTVNDPIATGSGTLTKAGSGTLLLEGTNTYTGTTTVSAGTLTVSGTLANTALTVSSGATYDVDATDTILSIAGAGTINLADAALTAGDGNNQTFSGTFVGDEKFTKAGAGTLTLSGNSSSYTGIIAISAGDISISNDNNLGNPNTIDADRLTFSGGDLVVTGNVTLNANRGITLSNAATFTVPSDTTLTISGIITSSGTLNKAGAGTLTLGGINTYSGTTNVDAGIVRVANAYGLGATGNGTVVDDGAALEFFNNSGNTIQFRAEPITINGTGISNGGAIRSIQGNNKFLGTITIGADTRINSDTESNLFEIASSGNITGTGLDIIFGGTGDIKVDDPINTGSGGKVTKDGSGELEISAASNYTGLVTVSAGTLTAANNTALGTIAGGVTVASGAILNLREGITVGNEALALVGSTLTNETSASWVAGYGGGNTNTYQGVITLTGNSTINSDHGTLTINSGGSITSASNHNITVGGSGAININDPISIGAGSITKVGGGVVQLQQNNTYSGGTVLTAGTLAPYAIGAIGSDITFNGGAIRHYSTNTAELYEKYIQPVNGKSWRIDPGGFTVNYNNSAEDPEVFNDVGSGGTNGFEVTGSGTLVMDEAATASTYTGTTVVSGGTLQLTTQNNNIASGQNVTVTGGTFNINGRSPIYGTLTVTGGTVSGSGTISATAYTINPGSGGTATISSIITNNGNAAIVTKSGNGLGVVSNTSNSFTGGVLLTGGIYAPGSVAALGDPNDGGNSGTITFQGGAIRHWSATQSDTNALYDRYVIPLNSYSWKIDTYTHNINYQSGDNFGNAGGHTVGFVKLGSGILEFDEAESYSGLTKIEGGTLLLGANNMLPSGGVTVSSCLTTACYTSGSLTAAKLDLDEYDDTVGAVILTHGSIVGAGGGVLTGTSYTFNPALADHTVTASAILAGSVTLTKSGAGTANMSGNNTYSGATSVTGGGLLISHANALGATSAGTTVSSNAVLKLSGGISFAAEPLILNGNGAISTTTTVNAYTGVSTTTTSGESGALNNASGNNTYTGAITMASSSRIESVDGTTLTINVASGNAIVGVHTLTLGGEGNIIISDSVGDSNGLALKKLEAGTVTLSAANTYTGTTTVEAGTLKLTGTLSNSTAVTVTGGTYDVDATDTVASIAGSGGTIDITGAALTAGGSNASTSFSGVLSGAQKFTKTGSGTLTLGGNSSGYTGIVQINAGSIKISADNNLGNPNTSDADRLILNGGTLETTGSFTLNSNRGITLSGNGTINTGSGTVAYAGVIAGSNNFTKSGSGTLNLTASNTYTGTTLISAGTLKLSGSGLLAGTALTVNSGGTYDVDASDTIGSIAGAGSIDIAGSQILNVGGNNSSTSFTGVISGAGALTKSGSGTLTLSGTSTFTGATAITAGKIAISSNAALGATNGATTVSSGAALSISGSITVAEPITISGTGISSGGAIVFTGGANTYSGAISLGATSTIVSSSGTQTISGATNGGQILTITTSDDLVISGIVGGSTELSSYTINSSGDATINVNVKTSGNQSYTASDGVALSGARTFEGGTITFASTTTGDNNLTITGNLDVDAAISGIAVLEVSGTSNLGANVSSTGTQTYTGAVTLSAAVTLTTTSDVITFSDTVNSANSTKRNLTLTTGSSSTEINFDGIVGGSNSVGAIAITGVLDLNAAITAATSVSVSGTSNIGADVTTTSTQLYVGNLVLSAADRTLEGSTVTTRGTLTGAYALTVTGNAVFGNSSSDDVVLTGSNKALAVSGTTTIETDTVTTSGTQTYSGAVVLGRNTTLTSSGDIITFSNTVNSDGSTNRNLTVTTGGNTVHINFDGIVGGSQGVGAIALTGVLDLNAAIADANSLTVSGVSLLDADITTSGTQTYSAAITLGTAARTLEGSTIQTTTINGAQNLAITGNLDLNGIIGGSNAIGVFSVSGTSNLGANVTTTGTQTYSGAVTLSTNATLTSSSDNFTFSSTVDSDSSTRNLTLSAGSGTIGITNAIGGNAALGTLTITQSGGVTFSGSVNSATVTLTDTTGSVTFASNTTLTTLNTASQDYNVIFNGAANTITNAVTFSNTGAITFGNASGDSSTFNGGLTTTAPSQINLGGTLQTSNDEMSLGDSNTAIVLVANSVLNTGSAALTVNAAVNGGYTLTLNSTDATTFAGIIGGSTALTGITTNSGGTVVFNTTAITTDGDQTYNDAATIGGNITFTTTGDDLVFASTVNSVSSTKTLDIVAGAGNTTFSGTVGGSEALGNTTIGTAILTVGAIKVQGTLAITNSGTSTITGIISDGDSAAILTKAGAGTLTLSGDNTYTGATTVNAGVLAITHADALGGTSGATTVANNAALNISGGITTAAEGITISGTGVSNRGAIRNISGDNVIAGQITIAAHTEIASDSGTLTLNISSSSSITASNKNVTFDGAGNITVADPIATGSGTLTKSGSGTLTLSGANTYTGASTISDGVLIATNATSLGTTDGATTIANGAELKISGGINIGEAITVNGEGESSTGAIRSTSGNNTLSGLITLGSTTAIQSDDDTLTLDVSTGDAITGSQTLKIRGQGNITISDPVAIGSATLYKYNTGTLTLTGTNTQSRSYISGGVLSVNQDRALGAVPGSTDSNNITINGGTLKTTASFTINTKRGIQLDASNSTINVDASTTLTYAGIIDHQGSETNNGYTKSGGGTFALSGDSTYSGVTTISAGVISIAHAGSLGSTSGATSITSGAALSISGGITVAEPITVNG
ncbi:autotransporter-associated beta strand repeat-containing protein, partial [Candidatus Pelagibacter sp.]|nr:autotransporter-associated beta strand repeat-containing protein [Candidatus Pelagibacter sp.]